MNSIPDLEEELDRLTKKRRLLTANLREAQDNMSFVTEAIKGVNVKLSAARTEEYNNRLITSGNIKGKEAISILTRCVAVFASMEKRGLGFDISERSIIDKAREFVLRA